MFGLIAGASPSFTAVATLAALWSVGVGGNLPVDSAVGFTYCGVPRNETGMFANFISPRSFWSLSRELINIS